MRLIYDIGMYDGSDTKYYLSKGYKVVAIEANPNLIEDAKQMFAKEIDSKQLSLVHVAIDREEGQITLDLCADDLGSSTIVRSHLGKRQISGSVTVPAMPIGMVMEMYGKPWAMKIDIEGADGICVKSLTKNDRPEYLSFEVGDALRDLDELMDHVQSIGYTKFKLIQQTTFLEIHQVWRDRLLKRAMKTFGFKDPNYAVIRGEEFKTKHSAGPGPWESNGTWRSGKDLLKTSNRLKASNGLFGWYDLHAS